MKRDAAQTIFRTVVFSAAMLGTAVGCGGKSTSSSTPAANQQQTAPTPENASTPPTDPCAGTAADPCAGTATDPCAGQAADPCAGANPCRPRPNADPCARPTGRGFVLS